MTQQPPKSLTIRCYYCNRGFEWAKGQDVCCQDCLPRREASQANLARLVTVYKAKAEAKKKEKGQKPSDLMPPHTIPLL